MNCADFRHHLDDWLARDAGELPAPLQAHVDRCAECRSEFEAYETLRHAMASWKREPLDVDLTDRVLTALAIETDSAPAPLNGHRVRSSTTVRPRRLSSGDTVRPATSRRRLMRLELAAAFVASATILLLLVVPRFTTDAPLSDETHPIITVAPPDDDPATKAPTAASQRPDDATITALVREAGTDYAHLAGDVMLALGEATFVMPPAGLPEDRMASPSPSVRPSRLLPGVLPAELQPVGRSVEGALDLLWNIVPEPQPPAT